MQVPDSKRWEITKAPSFRSQRKRRYYQYFLMVKSVARLQETLLFVQPDEFLLGDGFLSEATIYLILRELVKLITQDVDVLGPVPKPEPSHSSSTYIGRLTPIPRFRRVRDTSYCRLSC